MAQQILSTNTFTTARWIVSPTASDGTHTTIAAALTSASSGDTIFIRPGTYTENITLKAGVNLTAYGSDSSLNATGDVIINGTCTMTTAGSVTISGIQLQTNSAVLLAVTGSAASIVNLNNCYLNCTNNSGITYSSSNAASAINIKNCNGNLGTTGIALFSHSSAGVLTGTESYITNSGGSSTASTISSGVLSLINFLLFSPITSSSTATCGLSQSGIDTSAQNAICFTAGGSGSHTFGKSSFSSGSASAISISNTSLVQNCIINSTNTNAITGAGTINYTNLAFTIGSSAKINTTTQSGGIAAGGLTQAPSSGFLGQQITASASSVNLPNLTATNITSITLTPGIWDIGAVCYITQNGVGSAEVVSINTTSATLSGNIGIDQAQTTYSITAFSCTQSIPTFRATLAANTTYYLVAQSNFTTGTSSGNGRISATRVG
jgi:hypothetical protein